jgi:septal ring factor EnvC (AmiA/AmiB activator)
MKKLSTTKQVLHVLNTQGGKKPKQLIAITKAKPASVYNALNTLRGKKMIAKEEDGVYISQTQKEVSKVTNKVTDNTKYIRSLEVQVHQLETLHDQWRQNYKKLESDYTQAKIMYLNSQAVVTYLEEKVAQLIKG